MDAVDVHVRWLAAAPIYAAGYAFACAVFWWMARRRGMANETTFRLMLAGLIGGLAGANLVQLLATGLPGKTIEGGILGGWLAVIGAKRYLGVSRPTGDLFALALPAGEAIGRIACFVGGCCYGKVATGVPWAVYEHGALRHPTQLYLAIGAAMSFTVLLWLERRRVLAANGLFYLGGMLFCMDRFAVEFFRENSVAFGGLTLGQIGCCLAFFAFAALFARLPRTEMHAADV